LLSDATKLGAAVETAFFKHVFTRYYAESVGFSYWRDRQNREVDIVAEVRDGLVPFEVKYSTSRVGAADVRGLIEFCKQKNLTRGYVVTRELVDFEPLADHDSSAEIMKIPAPLACYWLSQSESRQ
jgi:predicted AAA+ superfamily ATPase